MKIRLIGLLFCSSIIFSLFHLSQEEDDDDNEIPVIVGDGGTITTNVEEDVLVLTHDNFDLQVAKNIILVEFYAPWCGHCKSLAPEYAKAAKILKEEDPPILLAKVDATIESDLASRFGVKGFPTMFIFRKGQKFEYDGPRSAMGIVEYMKQQADPNWKPPPEAVLTLTKDNFTETVNNADIILVEFYAPWCGHCKSLAPEYERAAKLLKALPTPIPLAKVDGIAERELSDKYKADGWPTLMVFRKGKKFDYGGPRQESGIVSYMKEQAKPPSSEIASESSLKNILSKTDMVVVGYFDNIDDTLFQEYISSAHNLREKISFYHTFDDKITQYFGAKKSIVLYQPTIYATEFEPSKFIFSKEDGKSDDILKFIKDNCVPLVGERSRKSMWLYQDRYPQVVVYYDVDFSHEHRSRTQRVRKMVAKVAKDYKNKVTFAVSHEEEYEEELVALKLDDSGEDVNVGYYKSNKARYRMEPVEDFSAVELKEFVEDVHSGNIPQYIKSQIPPKSNPGPVITVVGVTFQELVTDTKKDVLLEFYAPWCGHCKKLEPVYKKLAKSVEDNKNLMIAKIDATNNDFPSQYEIDGYPTIYFIPGNNKSNFDKYKGDLSLKSLSDSLNEKIEENKMPKEEL